MVYSIQFCPTSLNDKEAVFSFADFAYTGLQATHECFCSNDFSAFGELPQEECDTACTGESSRNCGGYWALSVYTTESAFGGNRPNEV